MCASLAEQASAWKPGSVLSVSGRLGGRDWQGKVYGDIVANTVEVVSEGARDDGAPSALHEVALRGPVRIALKARGHYRPRHKSLASLKPSPRLTPFVACKTPESRFR